MRLMVYPRLRTVREPLDVCSNRHPLDRNYLIWYIRMSHATLCAGYGIFGNVFARGCVLVDTSSALQEIQG